MTHSCFLQYCSRTIIKKNTRKQWIKTKTRSCLVNFQSIHETFAFYFLGDTFTVCSGGQWKLVDGLFYYLFILRIHGCEALSLSQSELRVGSQVVGYFHVIRFASAPPATPNSMAGVGVWTVGDTATTGGVVPGMNEVPNTAGVAEIGATSAVRPLSAASAGGGKAGLEVEGTQAADELPSGWQFAAVWCGGLTLPCPVPPGPMGLPLSAMAVELAS